MFLGRDWREPPVQFPEEYFAFLLRDRIRSSASPEGLRAVWPRVVGPLVHVVAIPVPFGVVQNVRPILTSFPDDVIA